MAGEDELQNEIWLWRGRGVKKHCERYAGMVRKRVSGEERVIAPVAKKRGAIKVKDHREVTLGRFP